MPGPDEANAQRMLAEHGARWQHGQNAKGLSFLLPKDATPQEIEGSEAALKSLDIPFRKPSYDGEPLWGDFKGALQVEPDHQERFLKSLSKGVKILDDEAKHAIAQGQWNEQL